MKSKKQNNFKNCLLTYRDPQMEILYKESIQNPLAANVYKLLGIYGVVFAILYLGLILVEWLALGESFDLNVIWFVANCGLGIINLAWFWILLKWPRFRQLIAALSLLYYYVFHLEIEIRQFDMLTGFIWFFIYQIFGLGVCIEVYTNTLLSIISYFTVCLYMGLRIGYADMYGDGIDDGEVFREGHLHMYYLYCFVAFILFLILYFLILHSKKYSFLVAYKTLEAFKKTIALLPEGVVLVDEESRKVLFHNTRAEKLLQCEDNPSSENITSRLYKCLNKGENIETQEKFTVNMTEEMNKFEPPKNLIIKEEKIELKNDQAILFYLTDRSILIKEEEAGNIFEAEFPDQITMAHESVGTRLTIITEEPSQESKRVFEQHCLLDNLEPLSILIKPQQPIKPFHLITSYINEIHKLSIFDDRKFKYFSGVCNIQDILNFIKEIAKIYSDTKRIDVDIEPMPEDAPNLIISDRIRIKLILINYISNILKLTAAGEIKISAEVYKDTFEPITYIKFSMKNSGREMQMENIEGFFNPDEKDDIVEDRMCICREIAKYLGGDVNQEGSEFSFKIPLKEHNQSLDSIREIEVDGEGGVRELGSSEEQLSAVKDESPVVSYEKKGKFAGYKKVKEEEKKEIKPNLASRGYKELTNPDPELVDIPLNIVNESRKSGSQKGSNSGKNKGNDESEDGYSSPEEPKPRKKKKPKKKTPSPVTTPPPYNPPVSRKLAPKPGALKAILIVHNDAFYSFQLSTLIKSMKLKARIDTVNDGYKAIDMLSNTHYNIVFMYWEMPLLTGFQTSVMIKDMFKEKKLMQMPNIIALTKKAPQSISSECEEVDIQYKYKEPITRAQLTRLLAYLMNT